MTVRRWIDVSAAQPGAPGLRRLRVDREAWRRAAGDCASADGRLLALWGSPGVDGDVLVRAAFAVERSVLIAELVVAAPREDLPGIADVFPSASRMQRALADLHGLNVTDTDSRPWLRHAAWPAGFAPLRDATEPAIAPVPVIDEYDFVHVAGDGVHEVAVGPVHAGIIEPGHFRFSVVGEKVLRLEQRLGYVHRGVERLFTQRALLDGHRLAARICGDSAVAFSWAYCQALEGMSGVEVPALASWLRAACLEFERISNHLGDLGALGNDAGFAFGLTQFSRLKETLLRELDAAFGQRYLLDVLEPGGVRQALSGAAARALSRCLVDIALQSARLQEIYAEHAGVRDRFVGAGSIAPALAARLGLAGLAGRASGQGHDLRIDLPCPPYDALLPVLKVGEDGDVAARVSVRFEELFESCRLLQLLLDGLPEGPCRCPIPLPADGAFGVGLVEGWRGPVLVALEAAAGGRIHRCHPHDPSWQNWPVLEHAIIDNILPDFPLINKSFNLAYSGHDL